MTLSEFNRGSQSDRASWIWQHGTFLADRNYLGHKIGLYHLGEFFAEIYYPVESNQVDYVRGFKNLELLRPYLDKINLLDILGN